MQNVTGWTYKLTADGLVMFPPEGKDLGAIRMQERVRPLQSVRAILAPDLESAAPILDGVELGPIERFETAQGEYAAFVTIKAHAKGNPQHRVERHVAIVFGDDFYQRFDAIVQDAAAFDAMRVATREFAYRATLGLGELRWRRYLYQPPAGWQPLSRVHTTEWYPLDYPRRNSRITIPAARPTQDPSVFDKALLLAVAPGLRVDGRDGPLPISNPNGLSGVVTRVRGSTPEKQLVYEQVVLMDATFTYLLRLECHADLYETDHPIFEQVVNSVYPLPVASRPTEGSAGDPFVHWVL
jgi:hypothetical protein